MKKFRSLLAAILASTMTISMGVPIMAQNGPFAQTLNFEKPQLLESTANENQFNSKAETVYLSSLDANKRSNNFNENWKFYFGEANGAESPSYNDSEWRDINLPHDYSIEQEFTPTGEAESGYLLGGIGWYRKNFTLTDEFKGKKLVIDFDGAYMESVVWLNGHKLGTHPYGYTSFAFELPEEYLNFNGNNIIAVQTNNKVPSSRWYSGSGIYRDVHLVVTNPVHVARYGTSVETPNLESEKSGNVTVNVSTRVENQSEEAANVRLIQNIYKKDDMTKSVATKESTVVSIEAGKSQLIDTTLSVNNPTLWQVGNGNMYVVETQVLVGDQPSDKYNTDFGFRYFNFDKDKGFSLNGELMKLKGVCMHHDQGALGSEAWYRAIERQVEVLQEMGVNSIRVTHNPAAQILVDICNEKGMLVIDEAFDTWILPKNGNTNDYSVWFAEKIEEGNTIIGGQPGLMTWGEFDTKAMISRGKNAPSIIMWSLGNEVLEGVSGSIAEYTKLAQNLVDWAQQVDSTRPITFGGNKIKDNGWGNASVVEMAIADIITKSGGVVGYNYASTGQYETGKKNNPDWLIYGSETASSINSRGVYDRKANANDGGNNDALLTAYDKSAVGWGATASDAWYRTLVNDYFAGEYVWTGFDYIGEPTPWNNVGPGVPSNAPSWEKAPKSSYFGIIETTGFPKDSFYFYQSQWNDNVNTLHVLPTWNKDEIMVDGDGNVEVVVYSDAAKVKLELIPDAAATNAVANDIVTSNSAVVTSNGAVELADGTIDLGTKEFTKIKTPAGYEYQIYEGADKSNTAHQNLYLTWKVPYQEGTLKATAYDENGNIIENTEGRSFVKTTGEPSNLTVTADRDSIKADGKDLSYITIDVVDSEGNFVNGANPTLELDITGDGVIVGVDNGMQPDHTSYQDTTRQAFNGKLLAIVQSTKKGGAFTLTASDKDEVISSASVTVQTKADSSSEPDDGIKSYEISRNYYVKTGSKLELPKTVKVNYYNDKEEEIEVNWNEISDEQLSKEGTFIATGTVKGTNIEISVNVNVIDKVDVLLNYSAAVTLGGDISLPPTRPAVLADGTIFSSEFPVTWNNVPENAANKAGIVTIDGKANVFGKEINVTATIRVSENTIELGADVAGNAAELTADSNSADAEKIRDNDIESAWTGSGEVVFRYDTAQSLGRVKLSFTENMPTQEDIELSWSGDGTTWIPITAKAEDNGTVRTYTLPNLVPAVFVKIDFKNEVSLAEAELIVGTSELKVSDLAEITSMIVNGQEVDKDSLSKRAYKTPAYSVKDITIKSDVNASYTVLPEYENKVIIITESEDHTVRDKYEILLRSEISDSNNPADSSLDYDYTKMTATAGSEHPNYGDYEGPSAFIIDNKPGTHWHTHWDADLSGRKEDRWVQLTLEEETLIDALRYLPRTVGNLNGIITGYRVEVSNDGENWTKVSEGKWKNASGWKIALFETPVTAKYIRLYGDETWADAGRLNVFISGAEARVRTVDTSVIDISSAEVTLEAEEFEYKGTPVTPVPVVKLGETTLEYGIDYVVSYDKNTVEGEATLTVTGIGNYKGTATKKFKVKVAEFTVTFETNGGNTINAQTFKYGTTKLPTPTRGNDMFVGWYTDEACTEKFEKVTEDMTLYAKWGSEKVVTFKSNNGEADIVQSVASGELVNIPKEPVKEGNIFAGWYTEEALISEYKFDTPITEDITLYARWIEKDKFIYGDVDNDGIITGNDAALVLMYVLNKDSIDTDTEFIKKAMVNSEGTINTSNVTKILEKALNSDVKFESEK